MRELWFLSELNLRSGCLLPPCTSICVGIAHLILLIRWLAGVTEVLKYFLKRVLYCRFTSISLVWKRDVNQQHCHFINCSYFQNHFYCYSLTNYPKSSKNCWLQGLIQLLFVVFHAFTLPWLLSYFFSTVAKSPANYVLSKLHITVEFVLWLMYIKTSRASESLSQGTDVPAPPGACVSTYSHLPFVLPGSFCFLLHS